MGRRTIRSEREWARLLKQQAGSGESIKNFCGARRISTTAFYRRRMRVPAATAGFVEISPAAIGTAAAPVEIEAGGLRIRVHDPGARKAVVEALGGRAC